MTTVRDIVPDAEQIMGCKAVFGAISSHILCFAKRGDRANPKRFYMLPAGVARRAVGRPFIIAIGGGRSVRDGLGGRVLNVARASTVHGDTATLLDDPTEIERLSRWPVAIALNDVWRLQGYPRLVEDLGMPDRRMLEGAVDSVIRHDDRVAMLWERIADWTVELATLPAPANFFDTGVPTLVSGGLRPTVPDGAGSVEGNRVWRLQRDIERDEKVSRDAKVLSAARHGKPTCEACGFAHDDFAMLDAHHPNPLASGVRKTLPNHLVILCPTCHRRAHCNDRLMPFTLPELREWFARGRP
ncbi:hypothetical protein [Novosphingobium sp. BW1]|uniref:hypothetical protein n=1 Tax=Novosphingobium sp. BW1 TaxID=2592621 RepID=UPI0011DED7BC|nr:hypothetical protein [Novosphingobium sp. BW1]TYC78783.1 hypothetical protein FMM79_20775 [Novosphingobium sp. BW1]